MKLKKGLMAIFVIIITACTPKNETVSQTAAVTAEGHAKILKGDLTDFAGIWVDSFGTRSQLRADGVFTSGSMGVLEADGFMYDCGAYVWNVSVEEGYGGYGVMLYPPGVPINVFYMDVMERKIAGIIETDTTKVRITSGYEGVYSSGEVYYREGELPAENNSSNGDLSGQ